MSDPSQRPLGKPGSFRSDFSGKSPAYFSEMSSTSISRDMIRSLKEISTASENQNIRICLHDQRDSTLHDMVVLVRRENYCRPHKHLTKNESYHLIEGTAVILLFDDAGKVIDHCILSENGNFLYRIAMNTYHTLIPLSDVFIFHESRPGPFLGPQDSEFPSWAPDTQEQGMSYTHALFAALGLSVIQNK